MCRCHFIQCCEVLNVRIFFNEQVYFLMKISWTSFPPAASSAWDSVILRSKSFKSSLCPSPRPNLSLKKITFLQFQIIMRLLLLLLSTLSVACGYKILCIITVPSKSHNHLAKGIVNALLDAGHEVTFATTYPDSSPRKNLTQIDMSAIQALSNAINMADPKNAVSIATLIKEFSRNITQMTLDNQQLQQTLVRQQFDAVVTEWFFSDVEAGFAAVQQVPWVLLCGNTMIHHLEELVDEVRSISTHPVLFNSSLMPMSLWSRLKNTLMYIMMTIDSWKDFSSKNEFYESLFSPLAKARGVTLPPYGEATHNVSILLVNSHPSMAAPRSLPPNVVDVAGYHIDENIPPLPKDLQDLLDSSPQGVVYFSMGSVVKSSALPETTRKELLQVLGELPYTVLWKFETELKGVPKNIHVRPWMPQASILAHPSVRVFITHGGLLSTLEAIHSGVPLLCVPVFGDQPANAERSVHAGFARQVAFRHDMAADLRVELKEMLANNSYYERAKYLSRLFRNRPTSPKKLVSHYVELAIESKGAYHLRSPSRLYFWYERWMLDQLALLAVALYLSYAVIKRILVTLRKLISKNKKQKRN